MIFCWVGAQASKSKIIYDDHEFYDRIEKNIDSPELEKQIYGSPGHLTGTVRDRKDSPYKTSKSIPKENERKYQMHEPNPIEIEKDAIQHDPTENPGKTKDSADTLGRAITEKRSETNNPVKTLSDDHATNKSNLWLIIGSAVGFLILIAAFVSIMFQYYSFYFNNSTEQHTPKESQAPDLISKEDIEEKNVEKGIVIKETHINLAFPSMSSSLFYDGRKARLSISTEITSTNKICSDSLF
jgi:hypothetical protein